VGFPRGISIKRIACHSRHATPQRSAYHRYLCSVAALAAAGPPVAVANPAQIRAFAKAIGQRAKTDAIDADVIAHFGEATSVAPRPLPLPGSLLILSAAGARSST
jgi:transposase